VRSASAILLQGVSEMIAAQAFERRSSIF